MGVAGAIEGRVDVDAQLATIRAQPRDSARGRERNKTTSSNVEKRTGKRYPRVVDHYDLDIVDTNPLTLAE